MNKNIFAIVAAALSLFVVSCQKDDAGVAGVDETRTVEVYAAETRTTIGYEASDVSHLEWCEGDKVAYVTNAEGDTFKSAEMKRGADGWYFVSDVSKSADTIYVVYPVGDNIGKTLAEAKASLVDEVCQVAGQEFNGELLPMFATAAITSEKKVMASYSVLASVVRFTIKANGHDAEILRSVTLTAAESLVGDYGVDVASGDVVFNGRTNSTKVVYTSATELGEDVLLANSHDIYMVVPSAEFSGVKVVVETDADKYTWSDGTMDLSHPERRLYRIALDLATAEGAPAPVERHFEPVCDVNDITDDGTYLIAVKSGSKYYVTNNVPTNSSNYYWVTGVELSSDEFGILHNDDAMKYTWNITKHDNGYMFYSPNMEKQGTMGVYLISQGGTGSFSGESGNEGKAWYVTQDKLPTGDGELRAYWDIVLDGHGIATLYNKYDRGVDDNVCYKYCTACNYFTLCLENAPDKADITLLKLAE